MSKHGVVGSRTEAYIGDDQLDLNGNIECHQYRLRVFADNPCYFNDVFRWMRANSVKMR